MIYIIIQIQKDKSVAQVGVSGRNEDVKLIFCVMPCLYITRIYGAWMPLFCFRGLIPCAVQFIEAVAAALVNFSAFAEVVAKRQPHIAVAEILVKIVDISFSHTGGDDESLALEDVVDVQAEVQFLVQKDFLEAHIYPPARLH